MGSGILVCFAVLFLQFLAGSGSSKHVWNQRFIQNSQASRRSLLSPSFSDEPELDTSPSQGNIPIFNPTTPTTTPPTFSGTSPPDDFAGPGTTTPPPTTTTTPQGPTIFNPTTPTTSGDFPPVSGGGGGTTVPPASTGGGGGGTTIPPASTGGGGGGTWCIASPSATATALQVALDYACGYGGADCSGIQPGASCYEPNTARDHASFAFNSYYQKHPGPNSCAFGGAAQLTNTDPSKGNCHFPSSSSKPASLNPPTPVLSPPSPPSFTTPPTNPTTDPNTNPGTTPTTNPTTTTPTTVIPGGGPPTFYGAGEPTGQPSSAVPVSHSLATLLLAATPILINFQLINP